MTTGKTVTEKSSNLGSTSTLSQIRAEWIFEDFEEGSSLVTFADFGSVAVTSALTSALAETSTGTVSVTGSNIIDLKPNNKGLTSVPFPSSSEVLTPMSECSKQ